MHKRIKQRELSIALNYSEQRGAVQSCVKGDNDARITAVKLQFKHARCCPFMIMITYIHQYSHNFVLLILFLYYNVKFI